MKPCDIPMANYATPAMPKKQPCNHKFVHMETVKKEGHPLCKTLEWKRIDRFYCEKCLEIRSIVKTALGNQGKPEWF